ncbi:MAG: hypothetical protein AAF960_18545 [Bacteroidota bacterium]
MNKKSLTNLGKAALVIPVLGFLADYREFQGDYGIAIMEVFLLVILIFSFLLVFYAIFLLLKKVTFLVSK